MPGGGLGIFKFRISAESGIFGNMTKRKSTHAPSRRAEPAGSRPVGHGSSPAAAPEAAPFFGQAAIRETIESIVVAFVLAFLFRTFEAEAFVIPTGSMAPTLMGKHKDLTCPECRFPYQVSASDNEREGKTTEARVVDGTCPMCRYPADLRRGSYPSYNGDRVLVGKFCYQFHAPERWDVIVFHYPYDATTNFIKRLVGLPGETLRISHGALWTRKNDNATQQGEAATIATAELPEKPYEIARKPPEKLLAMLQPVFDNDYMPAIHKLGWPERWSGAGWTTSADGAALERIRGERWKPAGEAWVRYQHLVPSAEQWQQMLLQARPVHALAGEPDFRLLRLRHRHRPQSAGLARAIRHPLGRRSGAAVRAGVALRSRAGGLRVGQRRPPLPVPHRSGHGQGGAFHQRPRDREVSSHGRHVGPRPRHAPHPLFRR